MNGTSLFKIFLNYQQRNVGISSYYFLLFPISGGSKGGGSKDPPPGSKFFQFHADILGKFGKILCLGPLGSWRTLLGEILDPPLPMCNVLQLLIFMKFYGVHYLIFSLILTKIDISIQVQDNKA